MMDDKWIIEACFCNKPLWMWSSSYAFWRLSKLNEKNGQEVVEVFYGLSVDVKNGKDFFVATPTRWHAYKNWYLHCLTGPNLDMHHTVVRPDKIDVIQEGSEEEIKRRWGKAKAQINILNDELQKSRYSTVGILQRDTVFPHNCAFQVLGDLMGFTLPTWSERQPGVNTRLVSNVLAHIYNRLAGSVDSHPPISPTDSCSPLSPTSEQMSEQDMTPRGFI